MSGKYAEDHADALATVREDGVAVAFTADTPGTLNEATGQFGESAGSSIPGFAIRKKGDLEQYAALGLDPTESPTLFWVPETYGHVPALGMACTFGGKPYTVKAVDPLAPDGVAIAADVIIAR